MCMIRLDTLVVQVEKKFEFEDLMQLEQESSSRLLEREEEEEDRVSRAPPMEPRASRSLLRWGAICVCLALLACAGITPVAATYPEGKTLPLIMSRLSLGTYSK